MLFVRRTIFFLAILHLPEIKASLIGDTVSLNFMLEKNVSEVEVTVLAVDHRERMTTFVVPMKTTPQSAYANESIWLQSCTEENEVSYSFGAESFLNYLLRMRSCDLLQNTTKRMDQICAGRTHAKTVYYDIAYLKSCHDELYREVCEIREHTYGNPWQDMGAIPRHMEQGSGDEIDTLVEQDSEKSPKYVAKKFKAENDANVIKHACESVQDFLASLSKHEIYTNYSKSFSYNLNSSKKAGFSFSDLLKYENSTVPVVLFTEWYFPYIPFCEAIACGASYEKHTAKPTSMYSFAPLSCRSTVAFSIVLDSILAFVTIISNSLVLGVAARTKIMRNIPGYFKISLAVADLTVGVFVLPSCIVVTYTMYLGPLPFRYPGETIKIGDYIAKPLADFIGFFIILSFSASVITMAAASIDRYLAITKPFQYRQGQYLTKRRSVWAFVSIWSISFAVAIFPVFTSQPYSLSAFNLVLSSGVASSLVYAVALLIPLLAVWSLNGAMLKQVCADREKRSSIRATSVINSPQNPIKRDIPTFEKEERNSEGKVSPIPTKDGEIVTGESIVEASKRVVARNLSSNSTCYQKNDKRYSVPAGDGIIERLKRRRKKKTGDVSQPVGPQLSVPGSAASVERRLARTLAIMIGAFTFALLPNIATMIAYVALAGDTSPGTQMRLASTLYITSRILLSNSFWNCIIYSIRNPHFRRAMWAIFLCKKSKIDKRLRHSLNVSQWKKRSAMASCSGSIYDKRSLSKTSSTASSAQSYRPRDHRRSTMMWSLASNSPCQSLKGSSEMLSTIKTPAWRTKSHACESTKPGILMKAVHRSESTPVGSVGVSESQKFEIDIIGK